MLGSKERAEAWAVIECAGDEINTYWPIIENILDKERDEEIRKYIFESDKVEWIKIVEIINSWNMAKEAWKDTLWNSYVEYYKKL